MVHLKFSYIQSADDIFYLALPIDFSKVKNLGIFGSDAGANPDGPNGCSDRGCDQGTLAVGWGSGSAYHSTSISD